MDFSSARAFEEGLPPRRTASGRELLPVVAGWLVTRALVLWLFFGPEWRVNGVHGYIAHSLAAEPYVGIGRTLVEYPAPAVGVLWLPWFVVRLLHVPGAYPEGLLVLCLLADATFTLLLARFRSPGRKAGLAVWVLGPPLLGATAYARLDIVSGVLTGAALLMLAVRPAKAAVAAAVAAGLKLWPVLVIPAMAAPLRTRRAVLTGALVAGVTLAATAFVVVGWARLVSPLTWQADRGLQIEAVLATPAMLAWAARLPGYDIAFSRFNAFEVSGPGTHLLLRFTGLLTVVAAICLLWLWRTAFRKGRGVGFESVVWLSLTAVTAFIVTSKVLSAQYLLWLLPSAAAGIALTRSRALRAWAAVLLFVAGLTQLEYPLGYTHLHVHDALTGPLLVVLVARNLLLVVLLGWAAVLAVRGLRRTDGRGAVPDGV